MWGPGRGAGEGGGVERGSGWGAEDAGGETQALGGREGDLPALVTLVPFWAWPVPGQRDGDRVRGRAPATDMLTAGNRGAESGRQGRTSQSWEAVVSGEAGGGGGRGRAAGLRHRGRPYRAPCVQRLLSAKVFELLAWEYFAWCS